jgi:hypothetical protein
MASFLTYEGAYRLQVGGGTSINWGTSSALYARLGGSGWSPNKDDTAMTGKTALTGADDAALNAGNTSIAKDTTNDRVNFLYDTTITFATVDTSQTAAWVAIYVEDAAADATRVPICYIDITDTPTNGGDIVISFTSNSDVVFYLQQ